MPRTYAVADQDRSIVSVIFPNGINRRFLQMVRKVYAIDDSTYSSIGLDSQLLNEDGHAVIFYRRDKPIY